MKTSGTNWFRIGCAVAALLCAASCDAEPSPSGKITQEAAQEEEMVKTTIPVKITAGGTVLYAEFEDNAASRAFVSRFPLSIEMTDLYGRELCHRFGAGALPTEELRSDNYEIGDIAYWPPRGSLVILYAQNGERFSRQHLGRVVSGVETLRTIGDAKMRFETADE